MGYNYLSLDYGGLSVFYSLVYPETRQYFNGYLKKNIRDDNSEYIEGTTLHLQITPEYMEENRWLVEEEEESMPFLEFQSLMLTTGNALLPYHRALFHGVSFIWKGLAWILTAPSGTGKTTQLKHWYRLFKDEIEVINGDKPLLECREDGSVWVYSSPWRGKERIGFPGRSGKLGGIILLEQANDNQMIPMKPEEAVYPLFSEFVSYPETCYQIRYQGLILERILDAVPVWKLRNLGDEASVRMTRATLDQYLADYSSPFSERMAGYPSIDKNGRKEYNKTVSSDSKESLRRPHPGIELLEIKDNYLLVADKEARKTCHYITRLNEMGALIWRCLQAGMGLEEILSEIGKVYDIPDRNEVKEDVAAFLRKLEKEGYLLAASTDKQEKSI